MNAVSKAALASVGLIVGVSAIAIPVFAQGGGNRYMRGANNGQASSSQVTRTSTANTTALSNSELQTLSYMLEEEKLAHDMYVSLYEKWGVNIFSNISKSETKHQSSLAAVASYYGVSNPSSSEVGVFTNQDLQKLYNDLLAKGLVSQQAAYEVGKAIEEQDISDLESAIAGTDSTYLKSVYAKLLQGSQNHLNAFNRQLS